MNNGTVYIEIFDVKFVTEVDSASNFLAQLKT